MTQGCAIYEVTFAIPCLDEAATIGRCVAAALECVRAHGLTGEVVVADNGSADGSADLARRAGARVVEVAERGYGAAVRAAVAAARGTYVVLGDADGQHDFAACPSFLERLRRGDVDLVVGNRRVGPGGRSSTSAANWFGAAALSWLGRTLFRAPVGDFHCGLRAFPRARFLELGLRSVGFELTTEHIARAALAGHRIAELPVAVRPAERGRRSHLRPWRDGLRIAWLMLRLWWGR